jgi:serine/threonine-protein kinase RsbW
MDPITRRFRNLELAIDTTHTLFEEWLATFAPAEAFPDDEANPPDPATPLHHARLVLHEWLANLVQHADFQERTPDVLIRLRPEENKVHGIVVDNSEGFPLERRLETQTTNALPFPERAMGLRFIDACTDSISYDRTEDGRYQFEFSISIDHTPWLSNLF